MFIHHEVNQTALIQQPVVLHSRVEVRCTCGALIMNGALTTITPDNLEIAFDKHMIGVLEYVYVRQFNQAGG